MHALCLTSEFLCCIMFRAAYCDWLRRKLNPLCLSEISILIWNFSVGTVLRKLYKNVSFMNLLHVHYTVTLFYMTTWYHSSLGPFCLTVGSRAPSAVSFYLESGSMCFSLM